MSNTLKSITNSLLGHGSNGPLYNLGIIPNDSFLKEFEFLGNINDIANDALNAISGINQVAHMAYCIGEVANKDSLLKILDNITNNIAAVALEMAERLASVLQGQIMGMFGTLVGTALNLANSILDFLTSVVKIYQSLMDIWDNIRHRALGNWKNFMATEDCEYMFASIASCMLNKLFGDKLSKFEQKVTRKITETGQKINTALSNELADVNNLGNYIRHESFMLEKANAQLQLFA